MALTYIYTFIEIIHHLHNSLEAGLGPEWHIFHIINSEDIDDVQYCQKVLPICYDFALADLQIDTAYFKNKSTMGTCVLA